MIEKSKKYRTKVGHQVRIYATDCGGDYPVHGAIRLHESTAWVAISWRACGRRFNGESETDLIEVRPRIKRTVWLAMYDGYCTTFLTPPINLDSNCVACVKVDIDCEHGEGLKRD